MTTNPLLTSEGSEKNRPGFLIRIRSPRGLLRVLLIFLIF
jgi:hypothetical protein